MTITETSPIAKARQVIADTTLALDHIEKHAAALPPWTRPYLTGDRILLAATDADELAALTRILTDGAPIGTVTKRNDDDFARVTRRFGAVTVEAHCARDKACTARVVGTETVEIPDPAAPKITVERDIVEWDCKPILALDRLEREGEWT
jgi:hypothetical protein